MELQNGMSVEVVVSSVQVYGLWCIYDGRAEMLINIPETSWIASFNSCEQFSEAGDSLRVKILNIDDASGRIAASIRAQFPSPWESDSLRLNQQYAGKIARFVESADRCGNGPAHLVELIPGSFAMLPYADCNYEIGQTVNVIITELNPRSHHAKISLGDAG